jgi:hypothetical protein
VISHQFVGDASQFNMLEKVAFIQINTDIPKTVPIISKYRFFALENKFFVFIFV